VTKSGRQKEKMASPARTRLDHQFGAFTSRLHAMRWGTDKDGHETYASIFLWAGPPLPLTLSSIAVLGLCATGGPNLRDRPATRGPPRPITYIWSKTVSTEAMNVVGSIFAAGRSAIRSMRVMVKSISAGGSG